MTKLTRKARERSQVLRDEWARASERSPELFRWLDCEGDPSPCDAHEITTYPTMRLFRDGDRVSDYKGVYRAFS